MRRAAGQGERRRSGGGSPRRRGPRRHEPSLNAQNALPAMTKTGDSGAVLSEGAGAGATGVEADDVIDARAAAMLPADLLHDDEIIILMLRPSVLYVILNSITSLALIGLLTFLLAYLARFSTPLVLWTDAEAFVIGAMLVTLRLAWQTLDWFSRVYVLTDRRIIRRMGVLRVAIFQADLKMIQHTSVFRRVRERAFGLGTIGFATAGSDVYEAFWVMIAQPFRVHKTVVEAIRRYGKPGKRM